MSDANNLAAFLDLGWDRLARGLTDAMHPARLPVLASVSPEGAPEAQSVVLREANRADGSLEVHTDGGSAKVASFNRNPRAQFHIWDPEVQLQLRLSTEVTMLSGEAALDRWQAVPKGSRIAYGTVPKPGTIIANAHDYEKISSRDCFVVLQCCLISIELMQLTEPHRRAIFKAIDGWAGQWCVP